MSDVDVRLVMYMFMDGGSVLFTQGHQPHTNRNQTKLKKKNNVINIKLFHYYSLMRESTEE